MYEAVLFQTDCVFRATDKNLRRAVTLAFRQYFDPKFSGIGGAFPAKMCKASEQTTLELVQACDVTDSPRKNSKCLRKIPQKSDRLLVLTFAGRQPFGFVRPLKD